MHIILLSGGAGKRLWPLSNEIRSKQFLKLLKNGDEPESMLQRVYRQIRETHLDAQVMIASSKSQAAAIRAQLSDKMSICTEPFRRDTFPAIVLSCAYLHDVLHVNDDESIVVCPIDPYVDDSYYSLVHRMGEIAGVTNLTLMGIEPNSPSDKYGYIIPETEDKYSKVKAFQEKPDRNTAKKYLQEGALWNAGVFAFKLSYILQEAHRIMQFKDYEDLLAHYDQCPAISFDYAIAEREKSVSVIRYQGGWMDIGSWNTLTEVMDDQLIGEGIVDETTEHTNVINELGVPILVMGAQNMIIAASADGILVSDKAHTSDIKPYVDQIATDIHYANKSWGTYQLIDEDDESCTIKILLYPGRRMSYHSHEHRDEVWTVISGRGHTVIDGMEQHVKVGDVITMQAGCKHTIVAETQLQIIEVQLGKDIDIHDKHKYRFSE